MAEKEHKGLVARWLEGKERSEDYARSTLPTNRWSLFWDILKGRFGRLMLVNLLVLITCLPIVAVYFLRYLNYTAQFSIGPYGSALLVGYPVMPNVTGVAEYLEFQMDLVYFALYIVAGAIASVGISGGMYIVRNLVWTEGIFVANDFVRGIKRNYLNVLEAVTIFTVALFTVQTLTNLADVYIAVDSSTAVWMTVSKVVSYIFLFLILLVCLWMISLGINYKQGPWALFRNAVIMTFGTFPQTLFFAFLALIPYLLMLFCSGFLAVIGVLIFLLFGISYSFLVWMDYSQWAFDKFINPDRGYATGKGIYSKDGKEGESQSGSSSSGEESAALKEYRRLIAAQGRSNLMCRPIKPIDDGVEMYQLPESFSRDDLQKLKESKTKMEDVVKEYEEEHKNDEQFVEYNRRYDEQQRAISEEESGSKKKKKKQKNPPKMLNKR